MSRIHQFLSSLLVKVYERRTALSLRLSVTLLLTLYVALTYLTLSGVILRLEKQKFLSQAREEAMGTVNRLAKTFSGRWSPSRSRLKNKESMEAADIKDTLNNPNIVYVVFQDNSGRVAYVPKALSEFSWIVNRTQFVPSVRIRLAVSGSAVRPFQSYPKTEIREFITAVRGKGQELLGVLRLGLNETNLLRSAAQASGRILINILAFNLVATFGVALITFWLMTRFETPIHRLYERAKKLSGPRPDEGPSRNIVTLLEKEFARLEGMVKQLRKSQTDVATALSHELRPPLQVIVGYVGVLRHGGAGPISREVDHFLRNIEETAKDFETFIDNVLDMARLEEGSLILASVPVNAEMVLRKCGRMFEKRTRDSGIRLLEEPGAGNALALGDEGRIVQVMVNLISNSIKFTPSGGAIRIGALPRADFVEFFVRDSGLGIPKDKQLQLFQEFYQVPEVEPLRGHKGLGIGLALSKRLVEVQGGAIWVDSEAGKGTSVHFKLKAAPS
jgi:signal transduction histidine kinase